MKALTVGDLIAALRVYPSDTTIVGVADGLMSSIVSIQEAHSAPDSAGDTLQNVSLHIWHPDTVLGTGSILGHVVPGSGADKRFIVYWRHGKLSSIAGPTVDEAFAGAGFGAGALAAVDFYEQGEEPSYVWDSIARTWLKSV